MSSSLCVSCNRFSEMLVGEGVWKDRDEPLTVDRTGIINYIFTVSGMLVPEPRELCVVSVTGASSA